MMQDTTQRKRYLRQASAIAASGRITRPVSDVIPTHGAVSLPANGGYYSTRVEGCRYKEILSFESAYSEVAGSDHGPDGPFDTLAMTVIEGLNILNVVTCDRVVARIASKFPTMDKDGKTINEPDFTTVGSRFERLRIGNHFFDHLDLGVGVVCDCGSWTSMQKGFQGDSRNALMKAALFPPEGNALPRMLGFSLAPSPEKSSNITEVLGQIYVPQFGTVNLGEFFVTQYSRQLVMLRVELGCPVAGDTTVATASMVGDSFPP
jgi:hypothetical protein